MREFFDAEQGDKGQFFSQLQGGSPGEPPGLPRRDLALRARAQLPAGPGASCLLHLSPPEAGDGYWVVVALDLSQHNAAISLASRMQMRFDTFAAIVDDGIAIVDLADDRLCQTNEATRQVLGLQRTPEAGEPSDLLWQSLVPADRARAQTALQQAAGQRSQELIASP
ncbi:MAG: PAS domain-containing protein [Burkholderiaceae bacterium]